jgi:hypothetical protein
MSSRPALRSSAALPLLLLGLAGCGGPSGYPSLAPRPIEQLSLAEPDRPTPPPAVASPEAVAQLAPTVEQARKGDAAFRQTLEEERPTLARGRSAAAGSEAWTAAQVSLSRIETARAPIAQALATLDAARNGGTTQTDSGEAVATAQAFDQVQQIYQGETAALAAIWPSTD